MAQITHHDPNAPLGSQACPSEAELRAVAEGTLPEPHLDTILQHLASCDRCDAALSHFSDEQTRVEKHCLPPAVESVLREPQCQRMQEAIRDLAKKDPAKHNSTDPARRNGHAHLAPDEESTDRSRLSTDDGVPKRAVVSIEATTTFVPTIPRKIGRYEVRSLLGEGAYGQVFLAHDPQLDRPAAIKVAKYSAAIIREQFLREAKVAAKLKHPGIVTVYDADVDDKVGCYIVMEYVEGRSLKQLIEDAKKDPTKKISHEQAADYIAQAAEALAEAHKIDLVHRDIKPANLLLGKDGRIKVADFGLAIFEEEQRKHAGEFAGTIAYCSPEQIRGETHHLDGRTDIWSLGVVLYELLTSRRPFGGPNITDEILHRPAKPPRQLVANVPCGLERTCLKCLAKAADLRFPTASDLCDALVNRKSWKLLAVAIGVSSLLVAIVLILVFSRNPFALAPTSESTDESGFDIAIQRTPSVEELGESVSEESYHMDEIARPGQVVLLHFNSHRELFALDPNKDHVSSSRPNSILVDSRSGYLVGLGDSTSPRFELSVELSRSTPPGISGVFWGLRAVNEEQNLWTCQLVAVAVEEGDINRLIYGYLELCGFRGETFDISRNATIKAIDIASPTFRRNSLRVVCNSSGLESAFWCGQSKTQLPWGKSPRLGPRTPDGDFGLITLHGGTVFQNPTFRLLQGDTDAEKE